MIVRLPSHLRSGKTRGCDSGGVSRIITRTVRFGAVAYMVELSVSASVTAMYEIMACMRIPVL
jgi:hypothetical protein